MTTLPMSRARGLAAALLAVCGACGGSGAAGDTPAFIARDTTALACTELFRPGDSLPPRIAIGATGPDGRFVWQPAGRQMLIVRAADGREIRIDGHATRAPFFAARQLGWLGDTLWITDGGTNRLQRFGPDGQPAGPLLAPDLASWVLLPGGQLRATAPRRLPADGVASDTVLALIGGSAATRGVDTLALLPTAPLRDILLGGARRPNPLTLASVAAVTGSHARWCGVRDTGGPVALVCFTIDGQPLFEQPIALARRPVTDSIYDLVLRTLDPGGAVPRDSLAAAVFRPDSLPFAFGIRSAPDDALWLQRSFPGEPVQRWLRLAPDGAPRDEVRLPARFTLFAVAGDSLWAGERDDMGFDRLTRCAVKP